MMKNTKMRSKKNKFIVLGLIILMIASLNFWRVNTFFIKDKNHKVVYSEKIKEGTKFTFEYIHSVSKTPIEEELEIKNGCFKLIEVRYIDQGGAGMPEFSYGEEKFEKVGDKFIISNFDRVFQTIPITVQTKYKDTLVFENITLKLDELLEGNGTAILFTDNISIMKFLYYKVVTK